MNDEHSNSLSSEESLLKANPALKAPYRQLKGSMGSLIQAIKKHISAIGSLLIAVTGRFPDAIAMPERPIARLEQLDWLAPLFGISRGMIGIRPPQATLSRDSVKVRTASCYHLIVAVDLDDGSIKDPSRKKEGALFPTAPCIGYLDHPFKNKHVQTEKEILSLLANTGGSV